MEIQLCKVAKRFRYEWIFKDIEYTFRPESRYVLLGANGSGKSTLMKMLSGHLTPSKGSIFFLDKQNKAIDPDSVYRFISYAAPYIELVEEFTLTETLDFHQKFKAFAKNIETQSLIETLGFEKSRHKEIRFFSSGMKQRLKLALAICSDTPILLLDEPTTNLDAQGVAWYKNLLQQYLQDRLLIIATNVPEDYEFICDKQINILDYKS
jgi:ABC-type multidrug transport system ATPase subunit